MRAVPALALAVLLASCASPPVPPAGGGGDPLAQAGRWILQRATHADGRPMDALAPHGAPVHRIEFADGRATILGGCNHIGADYRFDAGGDVVIGPLRSTKMACEDAARMAADAALAGLLEGRAAWRIAESWPEQLTMDHADGRRSHWVADRPSP